MTFSRTPTDVCNNCIHKQISHTTYCPFAAKYMCPDFQAFIATEAIQWKEAALQIPVESLLAALRWHGYTGELRKQEKVTV